MAKIYQRKRNGVYLRGWYVRVDGRQVNLHTKNADEAKKRAKLALKGKRPWEDTEAAAAVAADALQVEPEGPEELPNPGRVGEADAGSTGEPAAAASPPVPPGSQPDETAAAAAAAAAEPGDIPAAASEEEKRAEFRAKVAALLTGKADSGKSIGRSIAMATVMVEGGLIGRIARRMTPPRYLVFDLDDDANGLAIEILALGWDEQLRRWGMRLAELEPYQAILLGSAGIAGAMMFSLSTEKPAAEPEPERKEAPPVEPDDAGTMG